MTLIFDEKLGAVIYKWRTGESWDKYDPIYLIHEIIRELYSLPYLFNFYAL